MNIIAAVTTATIVELCTLDCPFTLPEKGVNLEAVERGLLAQALERTRGNQSRAARLLGITRYALRYRMAKFRLV